MEGPDEKKKYCLQRFCTAKKQQNAYGLPTILKRLKTFYNNTHYNNIYNYYYYYHIVVI